MHVIVHACTQTAAKGGDLATALDSSTSAAAAGMHFGHIFPARSFEVNKRLIDPLVLSETTAAVTGR